MNDVATLSREGQAIVTRAPAESSPATNSLLNVIAMAAADPAVDVNKLESLLRMQREVIGEQARHAYVQAMSDAQAEMVPVVRDAENLQTRSRYARLETIDALMRPIYSRHGFSLTFNTESPETPGNIRVVGKVAHHAGHFETFALEAPPDTMGAKGATNKTALHGLGSTVSYLRRYLTCMVFNIVLANEDDDGQGAGNGQKRPAAPDRRDYQQQQTPKHSTDWVAKVADALWNTRSDPMKWLGRLLHAFDRAPTLDELDEITRLPVVNTMRNNAPPEAIDTMNGRYDKARDRLTAPPTIEGETSLQSEATDAPPFEAMLIDGAGDPADEVFTDPLACARAYVELWDDAFPADRAALEEYNADALVDMRRFPEAATVLSDHLETSSQPSQPSQAKSAIDDLRTGRSPAPRHVTVMPPSKRGGGEDWRGYMDVIRRALADLRGDVDLEPWALAQRDMLAACPLAQRALTINVIASAFGVRDQTPPPWLGGLMRGAPRPVPSDDERWAADIERQLRGIPDRDAYWALANSDAVRARMSMLRTEAPALFARANEAFQATGAQFEGTK